MRIVTEIFSRVPNACVHAHVHAYACMSARLHVRTYVKRLLAGTNSKKTSKFFKIPIYFPDSIVYSVTNTREQGVPENPGR